MNFFVILLFLVASGFLGVLHRIPFKEIGRDFYRFVTLHYMVGMTIVLVTIQPDQFYDWIQFSLVLLATISGFFHFFALLKSINGLRVVSYWLGVLLSVGVLLSISYQSPIPSVLQAFTSPFMAFLHLTASAAILGAILDGMMCGHWYLVNPKMDLKPIRAISRTLTFVLLVKILLVILSLLQAKYYEPSLPDQMAFSLRQMGILIPILFWVRLLVGLSGGLFFNWMSWKAIEHSNPQAATGILYACIVWIILGEFSGFYITIQTGIPL